MTEKQIVVDSGSVAKGKHAEMWGVGLKYDADNLYLATTYSETQNLTTFGDKGVADKAQNFEAVLQYQFDFGLRPSLAFLQSRAQDVIVGGKNYGDQDLVKYVDVGAKYYFNKICPPMLIIKSIWLMRISLPGMRALQRMISLLLV